MSLKTNGQTTLVRPVFGGKCFKGLDRINTFKMIHFRLERELTKVSAPR